MIKIDAGILPESQVCMKRFFSNYLTPFVEDVGYSLRIPDSKGARLVMSTCVTKTVQNMFLQKSAKGNININESYDLLETLYETEENEGGSISYNKKVSSKDVAMEAMRKMVARFKQDFAGRFRFPEGKKFEDVIDFSVEANFIGGKITGKIPVVTDDTFYMYKVTERYGRKQYAAIGGYHLLLDHVMKDHFSHKAKVIHIPVVGKKTLQPDIGIHDFDDTEGSVITAINLLKEIGKCVDILKGEKNPAHIPGNPHCNMCSEKYCQAFDTKFCKR